MFGGLRLHCVDGGVAELEKGSSEAGSSPVSDSEVGVDLFVEYCQRLTHY